jgi:phosphoglycolate phosphatase-like HAD superfamily hydrolase
MSLRLRPFSMKFKKMGRIAENPEYATWIFDCDGVLLNSNTVKSDALYKAALPYGTEAAEKLLNFHVQHGGISRFVKFKHLFCEILKVSDFEAGLDSALNSYGRYCNDSLLQCETAPGLGDVLKKIRTAGSKTYIISGGLQDELRSIFKIRDLDKYFDGIFGSPDNKVEILTREISAGNIVLPAIFVGDSRYDYEAAHECGLNFIFVSGWTEFKNWKDYFKYKNVTSVETLKEITKFLRQALD